MRLERLDYPVALVEVMTKLERVFRSKWHHIPERKYTSERGGFVKYIKMQERHRNHFAKRVT